jgi:heptosyltransferase-3
MTPDCAVDRLEANSRKAHCLEHYQSRVNSMVTSILVVRSDNIGDLVCTTPLLAALRQRLPNAWIGVLANSYNAGVLAGHAYLDDVVVYRKAKHYRGSSRLLLYLERLRRVMELRRRQLDWIIFTTRVDRPLAVLVGAKHIAGFVKTSDQASRLDFAVPLDTTRDLHQVEALYRLGGAFGIDGAPPKMRVAVDPLERERIGQALDAAGIASGVPLVGIHISARKTSQRWPGERFASLMRHLHEEEGAAFVLSWAPGSPDQAKHPGDDAAARSILASLNGIPVLPWATAQLAALVAGFSACQSVICSDGGAMHIAAALDKPLIGFFGASDADRWRPWGVPHRVLQPKSRDVADLSVAEVCAAWRSLVRELEGDGHRPVPQRR